MFTRTDNWPVAINQMISDRALPPSIARILLNVTFTSVTSSSKLFLSFDFPTKLLWIFSTFFWCVLHFPPIPLGLGVLILLWTSTNFVILQFYTISYYFIHEEFQISSSQPSSKRLSVLPLMRETEFHTHLPYNKTWNYCSSVTEWQANTSSVSRFLSLNVGASLKVTAHFDHGLKRDGRS